MSRDIIRAALAEALRLFDEQAVPADVEAWIERNTSRIVTEYCDGLCVHPDDLRSLLAGKALVPIKATLEMINAALPDAMREADEDKYRAIGEIVCIWDAMIAAAQKEDSNE